MVEEEELSIFGGVLKEDDTNILESKMEKFREKLEGMRKMTITRFNARKILYNEITSLLQNISSFISELDDGIKRKIEQKNTITKAIEKIQFPQDDPYKQLYEIFDEVARSETKIIAWLNLLIEFLKIERKKLIDVIEHTQDAEIEIATATKQIEATKNFMDFMKDQMKTMQDQADKREERLLKMITKKEGILEEVEKEKPKEEKPDEEETIIKRIIGNSRPDNPEKEMKIEMKLNEIFEGRTGSKEFLDKLEMIKSKVWG